MLLVCKLSNSRGVTNGPMDNRNGGILTGQRMTEPRKPRNGRPDTCRRHPWLNGHAVQISKAMAVQPGYCQPGR